MEKVGGTHSDHMAAADPRNEEGLRIENCLGKPAGGWKPPNASQQILLVIED